MEKHGVAFEEAALVFLDPFTVYLGTNFFDGEDLLHILGAVNGANLFFVAHTERKQNGEVTCRIISARKATRRERAAYRDGLV